MRPCAAGNDAGAAPENAMTRTMTEAQRAALKKAQAASAAKRKKPTPVDFLDINFDAKKIEHAGPPELAKLLELPAAPPRMRRSSKDPKTPAAEVPAWVKSAQAGPPVPAEPGGTNVSYVRTSARKSKRRNEIASTSAALQAGREKTSNDAPAPGSLRAVGAAWLGHMASSGKTPATCSSYGKDLDLAYEFFGDVAAAEAQGKLALFGASKLCLQKKNGKPKAKPTILKTQRALRMALDWAAKGLAG